MNYLTTLLHHQSSITLTQLQSKIFANKTNLYHANSPHSSINQPQDLKVISPFYKRIDQHPQNCKCMYHKRIKTKIKKIQRIQKLKTQQIQIIDKKQQKSQNLPILTPPILIIQDQVEVPQEFETWKQKLSADTLKHYYYEYLKTIPSFSKFKRHKELDCYNHPFYQFLKNNYLVILDRKKTQKDIKNDNKQSHKYLSKVKTQGNIDANVTKKNLRSSKDNQSQFSQAFINRYPSCRDGLKIKKIVFKSTGKQLGQSDQEVVPKNDKKQKKTTKKSYSSRPSFFGLIQDQQVIRQICSRFIHPNKADNKEAELMMKQLAESDIEMYTKLMNDIEENLEEGLSLPNLDEQHSNMLVKIVLQKMSKEVQSIKNKDSKFVRKNSIIQNICSRFGWSKDQKQIGLQEFWKISQSAKNFGLSRKSFGTEKETKYKDQRSKSPFMSSSKNEKNSRVSRMSRMSGFSKDKIGKYFSNALNSQTGSNMSNRYLQELEIVQQQKEEIKLKVIDEFKINSNKSGALKKGVLVLKRKKKKLSGLIDGEEAKKISGLVRKETCFIQAQQQQKQLFGSNHDIKDNNTEKHVASSKDNDDRNSSIYSNTKNIVLRHIETNKKFLRRIENQLKGSDCDELVIGIGTNVLTKKRKIRAIYNAIQAESLNGVASKKYNNLLKYLQIYEEYCDLVVKMKKDKKIKSQVSLGKLSQPNFQEKESQAQQIQSLIQDLSKQRQLKYFNLKWLQEKQDPKQQLILKIPQKSKKGQKRLEDKKTTVLQAMQTKTQENQQKNEVDGGIMLQKSLEDHVNVYCEMGKLSVKQVNAEEQTQLPAQQKLSEFQRKLLSYRKLLKLQDQD